VCNVERHRSITVTAFAVPSELSARNHLEGMEFEEEQSQTDFVDSRIPYESCLTGHIKLAVKLRLKS